MLVRAKVTHTQLGTQTYRKAGEEFNHTGELYKHVEVVGGEAGEESVRKGRGGRKQASPDNTDEA